MKNQKIEEIIDLKQAMEMLGVSRTTFYRMMKEGKVKGKKIGGQWRFYRVDIYKFLKAPGKEDVENIIAKLRQSIDIYRKLLNDENEIDDEKLKELIPSPEMEEDEEVAEKMQNLAENLADLIIIKAVVDEVSDVHIEPYKKKTRIRHRDTETLYKLTELPGDVMSVLVRKIKDISGCDPDLEQVPQDGRFERHYGDKDVACFVNVFPCLQGDSAILRVMDKNISIPPMNELGLNPADLEKLENAIHSKAGLVIFTGPTGTGKTTAIYSCLKELNTDGKNIMTVEDPVELSIDGINQSFLRVDKGYTFRRALISMFRHDADVMMVAEIRDPGTAKNIHEAALTGHLVLTVLHTRDAAGAIARLLNIGIEPFLINDALSIVVGCRVVRKICVRCKERVEPDKKLAKKMSLQGKLLNVPVYQGKGCKYCHGSGYKGKTGIFEALVPDKKIRDLILRNRSLSEIRETALKSGMNDLKSEGLRKVKEGITTLEEVYEAVYA